MKKAYFAAGCFWGVEARFKEITGVVDSSVGYMGGHSLSPTYKEVCSDQTGHAEVVEVKYDETKINYLDLLKEFFNLHDPTTLNRQGMDVGTQYRSAIFTSDEQEIEIIKSYILYLDNSKKWTRPVVTSIESMQNFYIAEEYHQDYLDKNPGTCHI